MPAWAADFVRASTSPGPPPQKLDRQSAPELELAIDFESLPPIDRREADALAPHPLHRRLAACDQQFAQLRVRAVFGDATHVVKKLCLGIGAEIGVGDFLGGKIRHQRLEVVDTVVNAAKGAGGEAAVATGLRRRRALEHKDGCAAFGRRQRGTQRSVTGANDHDIARLREGVRHLVFGPILPASCRLAERPAPSSAPGGEGRQGISVMLGATKMQGRPTQSGGCPRALLAKVGLHCWVGAASAELRS